MRVGRKRRFPCIKKNKPGLYTARTWTPKKRKTRTYCFHCCFPTVHQCFWYLVGTECFKIHVDFRCGAKTLILFWLPSLCHKSSTEWGQTKRTWGGRDDAMGAKRHSDTSRCETAVRISWQPVCLTWYTERPTDSADKRCLSVSPTWVNKLKHQSFAVQTEMSLNYLIQYKTCLTLVSFSPVEGSSRAACWFVIGKFGSLLTTVRRKHVQKSSNLFVSCRTHIMYRCFALNNDSPF